MEVAFKLPLAKKLFDSVDKRGLKRLSSWIVIGLLTCLLAIVGLDLEHCYNNNVHLDPLLAHLIVYIAFFCMIIAVYAIRTVLLYYYRIELLKLFRNNPEQLEKLLNEESQETNV